MAYRELVKLHQLYDGFRLPLQLAGRQWLLLQEDGQAYLIARECPHQGASLIGASLVSVNRGGALRCPQHGMLFDLRTGLELNRACPGRLQCLPLVYEGNGLGVDV